jgi:hypothetical protein
MIINSKELLLENKLAPITTSFGLFENTIADVVDYFYSWEKGNDTKVVRKNVKGNLEEVFLTILPFKEISSTKFLFIPLINGWTAYFDNTYRGTDPTAITHIPKALTSRSIWVVSQPQYPSIPKNHMEALIMEVYGHEQMEWLNIIRRLRLECDGGKWSFEQMGVPFPFEKAERYLLKKRTDRFDLPLLKEYLHELAGLDPFDPSFYLTETGKEAVLVEVKTKWPNKDMSFSEACKRNNIPVTALNEKYINQGFVKSTFDKIKMTFRS